MTDTKQISDAINGLPDDGYIGVQQLQTRDYDDFCKTDDLKALVAENEALKEQLDKAKAEVLGIVELGHNLDCLFCGFKDKRAMKYLNPDFDGKFTTPHGGNDD